MDFKDLIPYGVVGGLSAMGGFLYGDNLLKKCKKDLLECWTDARTEKLDHDMMIKWIREHLPLDEYLLRRTRGGVPVPRRSDEASDLISRGVSVLYSAAAPKKRKTAKKIAKTTKKTTKKVTAKITKRRRKKKLWLRRDIRRPGPFRRMMIRIGYAGPGQSIPYWIKEQGCSDPIKTYKKLFGKVPKKARRFQKQACLARTLYRFPAAHRGPAKMHKAELPRFDPSIHSVADWEKWKRGQKTSRKISLRGYHPPRPTPTKDSECLAYAKAYTKSWQEAFFVCLEAKKRGVHPREVLREESVPTTPRMKAPARRPSMR